MTRLSGRAALALVTAIGIAASGANAHDVQPGAAPQKAPDAAGPSRSPSLTDLAGGRAEPGQETAIPPELAETGVPGAVAVVRLVRHLDRPDALLREAAINRLRRYPGAAGAPVVAAFATGSLQARLAALELLKEWDAPVAGLDPWRPATLAAARLEALNDWATKQARAMPGPASDEALAPPRAATADDLADAARELDRLLIAEPADAAAALERLARLGPALLPAVRDRLKRAEPDSARERLTALRYRLAASDALVVKMPGGLERLSATDSRTRHRAVDELVARVAPGDEPLLLELFNDPDPLVRETALKGLNAIGDAGDSRPLLALLADPEPNVRAAVLKELAEHPKSALAEPLAAYAARESDPDLVVHAVRVLREINSAKTLSMLVKILEHPNWSVRAEAVEAIGKKLQNFYMANLLADGAKTEAYAALTERLDDADGFVVGRALSALKDGNLLVAVEPLLAAADKHPELASKVIEALFAGNSERPAIRRKALPRLRKYASHSRVDVRAAVIKALGEPAEKVIEPEVLTALGDPASEVRVAAAQVLFSKLSALRPRGSRDPEELDNPSAFMNDEAGPEPPDEKALEGKADDDGPGTSIELWLTQFQKGKARPAWMEPAIAPLVSMLKAADDEERIAACLPLIALAREPGALPALIEATRRRPDSVGEAAHALPWLHWADRIDLFRKLLAASPGSDQFRHMASQFSLVRDTRTVEPLWALTTRDDLNPQTVTAINTALRLAYFGAKASAPNEVPKAERERALADVRPRATAGAEWQRVIALALLLSVAPDEAQAAARSTVADAKASPGLRRDAFQVLLLSGDREFARKEATTALVGREPAFARPALAYLTRDSTGLSLLRGALYLNPQTPAYAALTSSSGDSAESLSERVPTLPKDIGPDRLKPLLASSDPETAAMAGYALALLGDGGGLEPLLGYWRTQGSKDQSWRKRAYQAIAQVGDDSRIAVVEQIYASLRSESRSPSIDASVIKDLYWTIRAMDGPNARRLRQRIRNEVGMPFLRGEESQPASS